MTIDEKTARLEMKKTFLEDGNLGNVRDLKNHLELKSLKNDIFWFYFTAVVKNKRF